MDGKLFDSRTEMRRAEGITELWCGVGNYGRSGAEVRWLCVWALGGAW